MFPVNAATVPTASVTAIVSPTARDRARTILANIPESDAGIITRAVVSIRVAPNAREPSLNSFGTARKASSDKLAISGRIMTPTTIAPLSGFNGFGGSSIHPFSNSQLPSSTTSGPM